MHPDTGKIINVGITGQSGFIGSHLLNTIKLIPDAYRIVPFEDNYFTDSKLLANFVSQCDCIVHLAGVNRNPDPEQVYLLNIEITKKLIEALDTAQVTPGIIFSSSIQELRGNKYGSAKKESRELLSSWCERNGASFAGLLIPNVFGPFGAPFYNSVVATFSYQLANGQLPLIENDVELDLIYVGDLVEIFLQVINALPIGVNSYEIVKSAKSITVKEILRKLNEMKSGYSQDGIIPDLSDRFDLQLFNTFRSFLPIEDFFPFAYKVHSDSRGSFIETLKTTSGGQSSYSITFPGITRGNHFHTRKVERFSVLKGDALIQMRRIGTDKVYSLNVSGDNPSFIDMPVWYTHSITNIGKGELITMFWINEFFDPGNPDTYFQTVLKNTL